MDRLLTVAAVSARAEPSALEKAIAMQAVNWSSLSALVFLVYDILLTTADEIEFMWPSQWTWMKLVYYMMRYIPVGVQVSALFIGTEITPQFHYTHRDCINWQIWLSCAALFIVIFADLVLVLRVYALYVENHWIRWSVGAVYAVEIIMMAIGVFMGIPYIEVDEICLTTNMPWTYLFFFGSAIVFQLFLFGLTLYKFIMALKEGWGTTPLPMLLARDGTWAFFLLTLVIFAYGSLHFVSNGAYAALIYCWLISLYSFCSYRILLNLRKVAHHSHPSSFSYDGETGSLPIFTTVPTLDPRAVEYLDAEPEQPNTVRFRLADRASRILQSNHLRRQESSWQSVDSLIQMDPLHQPR
ncbi:hypothetical protein BD626DRAFT_473182 [Schizophyllum amplum]|uniref:DUF6533 domain-containing protein n=1 Tax=Schizophyllum amplum TaxID=97359 RepID=A0A550CWK6_9AGAR|nr:hypothetical protein BD626DRAFT_473182 [Auriculariopsis ampla]